jgi:hypothetical protein
VGLGICPSWSRGGEIFTLGVPRVLGTMDGRKYGLKLGCGTAGRVYFNYLHNYVKLDIEWRKNWILRIGRLCHLLLVPDIEIVNG